MDGTLFEHTDANFFPPFNLSPLHASITFPAPSPAPIPVCSDLVSSRHGKHQTSFFTVLRCITIDRSQLGRHSIRNNSDNDRSQLSSKGKNRFFLPSSLVFSFESSFKNYLSIEKFDSTSENQNYEFPRATTGRFV